MPAPKGNQYAKGNPGGGRPSTYQKDYADLAYKFCLLGATDAQLAEHLDVTEDTINQWKKDHKDFFLAQRNGKLKADAEVADKLYHRAIGVEWTEQQAFKVKTQTSPGVFDEEIKIVDVKRAAPPETQAISLWLRNRKSDKWNDKPDATPPVTNNYHFGLDNQTLMTMVMRWLEKQKRLSSPTIEN